jgi:hypothetical protein
LCKNCEKANLKVLGAGKNPQGFFQSHQKIICDLSFSRVPEAAKISPCKINIAIKESFVF